jgi:hypothetical protein
LFYDQINKQHLKETEMKLMDLDNKTNETMTKEYMKRGKLEKEMDLLQEKFNNESIELKNKQFNEIKKLKN